MKEPKLSRESKRAFVRRFAANVKRLMAEKGVKPAALGRAAYPESPAPNSAVYNMLHAAALPSDEVMATVAKVLQCSVEALHHGELEAFKGGEPAKRHRQARTATDDHGPAERKQRRPAGFVQPVALVTVPPPDDAFLYGFVFDALRECAGKLSTEPTRLHEFVVKLGRLCREYER
jgi:hypothetical protein